MRYPFHILAGSLISLTLVYGDESAQPANEKPVQVTLTDLSIYRGSDLQHPLMCGSKRDFPEGQEFIFRNGITNVTTHVIFPERPIVPRILEGTFSLRGHYQRLRKVPHYPHKIHKSPERSYRYFVVTSWEQQTK